MIVELPIALTEVNKLYLSSKFDIEPFKLSKKNIYGLFLFNTLSKKRNVPGRDILIDFKKYNHFINIHLTEIDFKSRGVYLSNQVVLDFNSLVRMKMLEEFHFYMDVQFHYNKIQIRQAIQDFMTLCNLHEDVIGIRTLEKDYERYRTKASMDLGRQFRNQKIA